MTTIIECKNKTNLFFTFFGIISFSILFVIIFILAPLISFEENLFLSIIKYIFSIIPFVAFFILILKFWIWNIFGKTILEINENRIIIIQKNKLFNKPKIFYKDEIERFFIKNLKIEHTKYNTRYQFSLSGATNSIILKKNNSEIRIVDWLTEQKAQEILKEIEIQWNKNYCS